mmetsp:Transcript_2298/g.5394  ORF Transcript_2298/g.5394 Transcript_2298/m.5394 type:complete len:87 (+) Transcript_2298:499-759(+)
MDASKKGGRELVVKLFVYRAKDSQVYLKSLTTDITNTKKAGLGAEQTYAISTVREQWHSTVSAPAACILMIVLRSTSSPRPSRQGA